MSNDLISRQAAIELKPEFLNQNVNRETEEQTAIDRAYARGWNSCNTHWIDEISGMPSAQPKEPMSGLKQCPFCGALPQSGVEFYESYGGKLKLSAVVKCTGCGVYKRKIFKATDEASFVPFYDYENAFSDVIKEWNRRVSDEQVSKRLLG